MASAILTLVKTDILVHSSSSIARLTTALTMSSLVKLIVAKASIIDTS